MACILSFFDILIKYSLNITKKTEKIKAIITTIKHRVVLPGAGEAFPINELIGTVAFRLKSNAIITDVDKATWKFSAQEEQ